MVMFSGCVLEFLFGVGVLGLKLVVWFPVLSFELERLKLLLSDMMNTKI